MATRDCVSEVPRITTSPAVMWRAMSAAAALFRAWKNRRAFRRLGEMTDVELADIGLTRADLSFASGLSLGVDPTQRLGAIAAERIRHGLGASGKTC